MSATGERATRPAEIRALTGLRAVVATWVLLFHFQGTMLPYVEQFPFMRPLISAGWTGVELFFVLSGFVITLAYGESMGGAPTVRKSIDFVVNRIARVWPAWAVVTCLMFAWIWTLRTLGRPADLVASHPTADLSTLARQLSMTQMWGRGDLVGASYILPGWSISAEWTAYLAFPLLVLLLRPLHRLPTGVLLALSAAAMAPLSVLAFVDGPQDFTVPWVLRISCGFTAGMLAGLARRQIRQTARTESIGLAASWSCLCLIGLGTFWAAWRVAGTGPHDYSGVIVVVFPLLVVALAATERGPAALLARKPLAYGGRLSYCLYLVHFAVLDITLTVFAPQPSDGERPEGGLLLAMPALIVLCFVLSALLHHGVEEPGRRLVLRLVGRRTPSARTLARSSAVRPAPPLRAAGVAARVPRVAPRTELMAAVTTRTGEQRQLPPLTPRNRTNGPRLVPVHLEEEVARRSPTRRTVGHAS